MGLNIFKRMLLNNFKAILVYIIDKHETPYQIIELSIV